MRCVNVIEGEEFALPRGEAERLRDAAERLRVQLRPSFSLLSERAGMFRLRNVVGTIDLGRGVVIEVAPKVTSDSDWTKAVVSLLTGSESIDVAGDRRGGRSHVHNQLLDAISSVYLRRLERAFRQEGPIVIMERVGNFLPYLHGKLDVSRWVRSAALRPHIFPVSHTQLVADNPFTQGLTIVADTLAQAASSQRTKNGLRRLSRDLAVGQYRKANTTVGLANRVLPEQWSAYKPAWALATSVLSRTSLFGPTGHQAGIGLAIEAWPLLETLLERTLQSVERLGRAVGRRFTYRMQGEAQILRNLGRTAQSAFSAEPDGRLFENGQLVANFEAKYAAFDGVKPDRNHIYQVLSTAAACGSPLAVLVYPNSFEPQVWEVSGFQGHPVHLIALGLDLFKWLPPGQSESRGELVLRMLDSITTTRDSIQGISV